MSLPARSVSAPASDASIPASGEAVTPAAQTTVRAETRSVSPSGARTVTPRASTSITVRESIGLTPIRSSERRARSDSAGGKLESTRSPASTSTMHPLPGSAVRKLRRRLSRASSAICPAISTPVGPAPTTTNESQEPRSSSERAISAASNALRIAERVTSALSSDLTSWANSPHASWPK